MSSGYADCKCRDCFELVVVSDTSKPEFCALCLFAGCEEDHECRAEPELEPETEIDDTWAHEV